MKSKSLLAFPVLAIMAFGACNNTPNNTSNSTNAQKASNTVSNSMNSNAASVTNTNAVSSSKQLTLSEAVASSSNNADDRVKAIDAYVAEVEANLPSPTGNGKLTRKEMTVKPEQLKGITEENWSKIHGYYEGSTLKRLKTYPTGKSERTEEFYINNDKPVFVFLEEQGVEKEDDKRSAKGEKLYFGDEGLFAWYGEDGKLKDSKNADFKKMNDKLMSETGAFRSIVQ